jgi:hypothetical protein
LIAADAACALPADALAGAETISAAIASELVVMAESDVFFIHPMVAINRKRAFDTNQRATPTGL